MDAWVEEGKINRGNMKRGTKGGTWERTPNTHHTQTNTHTQHKQTHTTQVQIWTTEEGELTESCKAPK